MKASNLIVILSDEHNKRVTGCYGHPLIKTPNLDRLAARGTRFTSAYTNGPICVPARASFATGQYVHEIRYWDNAIAYDGRVPSWGHRLMEQDHRVTSIGKLHYVDSDARRNGFDEEILPLHIVNRVGDLLGLISFLDDNIGKILATLEATGLAANTRVIYSSDHGDNLGARGLWGKSTMYEESAGIPLILAGPEVPRDNVCDVPVTLADAFPTLIEGAGEKIDARDAHLPGHSLIDIAQGYVPKRTILSEYHAAGAVCGSYMIRHGKYKYIHYVGLSPMLFDLETDPHERNDLGRDAARAALLDACEAELRNVVDPEAVDELAHTDQAARIAEVGGKEAILKRGTFRYSPPPGAKAAYY